MFTDRCVDGTQSAAHVVRHVTSEESVHVHRHTCNVYVCVCVYGGGVKLS